MQDTLISLAPFGLMIAVFYLVLYRPQQQEREAHDRMLKALTKDDRVVLQSGLHARVVRVDTDTLEIELSKGVVVKADRTAVLKKLGADGQPVADPK